MKDIKKRTLGWVWRNGSRLFNDGYALAYPSNVRRKALARAEIREWGRWRSFEFTNTDYHLLSFLGKLANMSGKVREPRLARRRIPENSSQIVPRPKNIAGYGS